MASNNSNDLTKGLDSYLNMTNTSQTYEASSGLTKEASTGLTNEASTDKTDSDYDQNLDIEEENVSDSPYNIECECLFCLQTFSECSFIWEHIKETHQIDIKQLKQQNNMDCFSYIKMVNYIRKHKLSVSEFLKSSHSLWQSEEYMHPTFCDDLLLTYDFDDVEEVPQCIESCDSVTSDEGVKLVDNQEHMQISRQHYMDLCHQLNQAEKKLTETTSQLHSVLGNVNKMRTFAQNYVLNQTETTSSNCEKNKESDVFDYYFHGYNHFGIHQEMLQDRVRTESYREAIMKNKDKFCDKIVLDIGCGTGILSMFAARAGAKHVIGIDSSDIVYQGMDIVRENNLENTVTLIKSKVEEATIPNIDKVDIIISEWMGYFLLFESMLDTVLYARDTWLRDDGLLLPSNCSLYLVGLDDKTLYKKSVSFWDNVYGFRMSCMQSEVMKETQVNVVDKACLITQQSCVKEINISVCKTSDLDFSSHFNLLVSQDGELNILAGYFDIDFCLPNKVSFSTSPLSEATHWKQTVFFLKDPIKVSAGETIEGQIKCQKDKRDPRSLDISITINNKTQKYYMN